MKCENCNQTIIPEISHSTVVVLQKLSKTDGYTFFQCEEGNEFHNMRYQHFCCGTYCMQQKLLGCINEHYLEEHLHPITVGGTTTLHEIVLSAGRTCAVCNEALSDVCYRFCLTHATPFCQPLNDQSDYGEWCCSLDHAKQNATSTINNIKEEQQHDTL